jgi:hypothetical protein
LTGAGDLERKTVRVCILSETQGPWEGVGVRLVAARRMQHTMAT